MAKQSFIENKCLDTLVNLMNEYFIPDLEQTMRMEGKYVTGEAFNSIKVERFPRSVQVNADEAFLAAIFGRRPGKKPPAEEIEKWVKQKLNPADERELKRLVGAITTKIGQSGTSPQYHRPNLLRDTFNRTLPVITEQLAQRCSADVRELLRNETNKLKRISLGVKR